MDTNPVPMPQAPRKPQLSLKDTSPFVCSCGNPTFQEVFLLRRASRLLTGERKDTVVTIPILACVKCSTPLEEMVPDELKSPKIV
jgi:hypothetical protein